MARQRNSQVNKFLLGEGIKRLTDTQITEKFLSEGKGILRKSWRYFLHQLILCDVPIETIPIYYDTFQSRPVNYDYRKSLLDKLVQELRTLSEDAVIIDGGCRTGIDICYLASQFVHTNMEFLGYDKSRGMIKLAEKRRQRLGLDNVEFYRGEHLKPSNEELRIADLVYTSDSRHQGTQGLKEYLEEFEAICRRVKPGGIYINAGSPRETSEQVKEQLDIMGIAYLESRLISTASRKNTKRIGVIAVKGSDMPAFYKHSQESRFYMNTFEVNLPQYTAHS